jgi:hypothetical protein
VPAKTVIEAATVSAVKEKLFPLLTPMFACGGVAPVAAHSILMVVAVAHPVPVIVKVDIPPAEPQIAALPPPAGETVACVPIERVSSVFALAGIAIIGINDITITIANSHAVIFLLC